MLGRRGSHGLLRLNDALEALGDDGIMGREHAEVPLADVVGTVSRAEDFDHDFRLVNPGLRDRWSRLEQAVLSGQEPPPVDLVRLGDLYFVSDGHHRVSVARSLGRKDIAARVVHVCTIAYAMCCIRMAHLPNKAAERRFLERVPLEGEHRRNLWLDAPADWLRLADAAEAWGWRQSLTGRCVPDRAELARWWWAEEVQPVLETLRAAGVGTGQRDVQLYAAALAVRDGSRREAWPESLTRQLLQAQNT